MYCSPVQKRKWTVYNCHGHVCTAIRKKESGQFVIVMDMSVIMAIRRKKKGDSL